MQYTGTYADDQDAAKPISVLPAANNTVVYGVRFNIFSPVNLPVGSTSNYLFAFKQTNQNFDNLRLAIKNVDGSNYTIQTRLNGQGANPFLTAGTPIPFGSTEVSAFLSFTFDDSSNGGVDLMRVWVNPSNSFAAPIITQSNAGTSNDDGYNSFLLSQFSNASTKGIDGRLLQVVVADNFSDAYAALLPEPSTYAIFLGSAIISLAWLRRRQY